MKKSAASIFVAVAFLALLVAACTPSQEQGETLAPAAENRRFQQPTEAATAPAEPKKPQVQVPPENNQFESCGNKTELLTVLPVDLKDVFTLLPLGLMVPPDHTLPAPHTYAWTIDLQHPEAREAKLKAPADMVITEVAISGAQNKRSTYSLYHLVMSPCREFDLYFINIITLEYPPLVQAAEKLQKKCDSSGQWCSDSVSIPIKAGDVIGAVGSPEKGISGVDVGARDYRIVNGRNFTNPGRACGTTVYPHDRCYTVCPYDYYDESTKAQLKFTSMDGTAQRTAQPVCGSIYYDVTGTAQGNWYKKGTPVDPYAMEEEDLFLGPDQITPTTKVLSVGVTVPSLPSKLYFFKPKSFGLVNRDFGSLSADGNIYCYEVGDARGYESNIAAAIILQMTSPTEARIEKLSTASCGTGPWSFGSSYAEFER